MSINKVTLVGHVGKEPKTTPFKDGGCCVQFSLATSEGGFKTKDGKDIPEVTQWHNIVVMRNGINTLCSTSVHKGDKLMVWGKLRYRTYTGDDGVQRAITEIYAEDVELCTKPTHAEAPAPEPEYTPTENQGSFDDFPAGF